MTRCFLPVVAVLLAACGGDDPVPDFSGQWSGTVVQSARCPDGTVIPRTVPINLVATQDDTGVTFDSDTSCGFLRGTFDGDVLTLRAAACDPLVSGSITYADTILDGTIALKGDALDVGATVSTVLFTSTGAGRCVGPMGGTLHRRD